MKRNLLITGGAGFIGSNFVWHWAKSFPQDKVVVVDALTYAGNLSNLSGLLTDNAIHFIQGDICDAHVLKDVFAKHAIDHVVHFAAESHVDRSIADPSAFIRTNIQGTFNLLQSAREAWVNRFEGKRFHHISTDEVYGQLGPHDPAFLETTPYAPRSPYAASKASSDMLVRAYGTTYGLPITISNCSNNYGPFHFPEKLIPLMVINALMGKPLPVYGKGENIRDWLYVKDHCIAIEMILTGGKLGETYNVGGDNEIVNIDLVRQICVSLDKMFREDPSLRLKYPDCPASKGTSCDGLITYVKDRPGHDHRYAIDQTKITTQLNFKPSVNFEEGLQDTIRWYLSNEVWWRTILSGDYRDWIKKHYGDQGKP